MKVRTKSNKEGGEQDSRVRYRKKATEDSSSKTSKLKDRPNAHAAGNLANERLLRSELNSKSSNNDRGDIHEQEAEAFSEYATFKSDKAKSTQRTKNSSAISEIKASNSEPKVNDLHNGHPLEDASRSFFEQRLGANLSQVRVHTDRDAASSAEGIGAEAYTSGSHIVFGRDRYKPGTVDGQRLLAHELAHVVQQTGDSAKAGPSTSVQTRTGNAGLIQRQPAPGAIADPVAFIENQLRLRFSDPDDPLLIVRIHRLQDAIEGLTISERRQLLDRLRDRSDELAKNFQRLATASRNRLRTQLLQKVPADVEGKILGTVKSSGPNGVNAQLIARIEITPNTEEAEMFEGFADINDARDALERLPTITAIIRDKKSGKYRCFDTGFPTLRGQSGVTVSANESGIDFEFVEWVNLEAPSLQSPDRVARIQRARGMLDAYIKTYGNRFVDITSTGVQPPQDRTQALALEQIELAYKELFEEALPFAKGQIHFAFEFVDRNTPGQTKEITTADPSSVNVDLLDIYAHGRQKMINEEFDFPGTHRKVTAKDAAKDPSGGSFSPYYALNPSSLDEELLETRRVLLHERAHVAHAQRTLRLIEDWKTHGSTPPFREWVENEVKNRRVRPIDAILAIERLEQGGSLAPNTELLAEVEGVMGVYHAMPLGRNLGLERIPIMASMWLSSNQVTQDLSIRKLHHYYSNMLDQAHKDAFDKYVGDLWAVANSNSDARAEFYLKLAEFFEIHQ